MFFWPIDMPHVKVWLVVQTCILVHFVSSMFGWDTCTCTIILIVDVRFTLANHGGAEKQFVTHMNVELHFPNSSYNILHVPFIYTLMHLIHAISCCISTFNAETFSTSALSILRSVLMVFPDHFHSSEKFMCGNHRVLHAQYFKTTILSQCIAMKIKMIDISAIHSWSHIFELFGEGYNRIWKEITPFIRLHWLRSTKKRMRLSCCLIFNIFCNASKAPALKWKFLHGGIIPWVSFLIITNNVTKLANTTMSRESYKGLGDQIMVHRIPVCISVQPITFAASERALNWISRHFRLQIISSCNKIVSNYKLLGS